jgi:hypothetical protein
MLGVLNAPVGDFLSLDFQVVHLLALTLIVWYCAYTGYFGDYLSSSVKDPASRIIGLFRGGDVGFRAYSDEREKEIEASAAAMMAKAGSQRIR